MASIMDTLFGVSTERFQEEREAAADAQALAFARLSPIEKASYGVQRGAYGLAGALGGALGGKDPALARNTMRQQIATQINFADLKSIADGVELLRKANDPQGAMMLADVYRKAESESALAKQRNAAAERERLPAVNPNIQVSEQIAALRISLKRLEASPPSPETDDLKENLTYKLEELMRLSGTKQPEFLAKAAQLQGLKADLRVLKSQPEPNKEAIQRIEDSIQAIEGVPKDGKTPTKIGVAAEGKKQVVYYDPNKDEQFVLDIGSDGKQVRKSYTGSVDTKTMDIRLPGQPVKPKDWMDLTQNVLSKDPIMQDTSRVLSEGPKLINIINSSTSNDISAAALPKALSAFIGKDSSLSNLDIATFAKTGGLDNRLAESVNKFFTGRATEVKKDQAQQFAIALYRGALIERKRKLQDSVKEYGYEDSPNYKFALESIDKQLAQFKLVEKGKTQPSTQKTGIPLLDKYLPQEESK